MFAPGTLDEEVFLWQDWAFIFKNYVGFMDPNYLSEFSWAESHDGPIKESERLRIRHRKTCGKALLSSE